MNTKMLKLMGPSGDATIHLMNTLLPMRDVVTAHMDQGWLKTFMKGMQTHGPMAPPALDEGTRIIQNVQQRGPYHFTSLGNNFKTIRIWKPRESGSGTQHFTEEDEALLLQEFPGMKLKTPDLGGTFAVTFPHEASALKTDGGVAKLTHPADVAAITIGQLFGSMWYLQDYTANNVPATMDGDTTILQATAQTDYATIELSLEAQANIRRGALIVHDLSDERPLMLRISPTAKAMENAGQNQDLGELLRSRPDVSKSIEGDPGQSSLNENLSAGIHEWMRNIFEMMRFTFEVAEANPREGTPATIVISDINALAPTGCGCGSPSDLSPAQLAFNHAFAAFNLQIPMF